MYRNVYINVVEKWSPNSSHPSFKSWHIDCFQLFILCSLTVAGFHLLFVFSKLKWYVGNFFKKNTCNLQAFPFHFWMDTSKRPAEESGEPFLMYSYWRWKPCYWLCSLPLSRQRSLIIWHFSSPSSGVGRSRRSKTLKAPRKYSTLTVLLNIEYCWMLNDFVDIDIELLIVVTLCLRKQMNSSLKSCSCCCVG